MTEAEALKIIEEWKSFWMDQTQNSEADFENYFSRAFGVDANMAHDLARRLARTTDPLSSPAATSEANSGSFSSMDGPMVVYGRKIEILTKRNRELEAEVARTKSEHHAELVKLHSDYEGMIDEYRKERDRLRATLEKIYAQDQKRGYPTGEEWMAIIDIARKALEGEG